MQSIPETGDNRPLSEIFRIQSKSWVDADAAANLLEDCKSAILAERMQEHASLPISRAEQIVKASPEWRQYIERAVEARKFANLLKVKLEWIRMRFAEQQSHEATARAERRL